MIGCPLRVLQRGPFEIQPIHTMYMAEDFTPKIGMRNSGKCTMCGHDDLERNKLRFGSGLTPINFHYVCKNCGYTEFYKGEYAKKEATEKEGDKSATNTQDEKIKDPYLRMQLIGAAFVMFIMYLAFNQ